MVFHDEKKTPGKVPGVFLFWLNHPPTHQPLMLAGVNGARVPYRMELRV